MYIHTQLIQSTKERNRLASIIFLNKKILFLPGSKNKQIKIKNQQLKKQPKQTNKTPTMFHTRTITVKAPWLNVQKKWA